jgi:hypothetical protein
MLETASHLCAASTAVLYRFDGDRFTPLVGFDFPSDVWEFLLHNRPRPGRGSVVGRVAAERRTIHVADVLEDPE